MTFTCVYGGEDFDARRKNDETDGTNAMEMMGPGGALRGLSCAAPPLRAIETILPVARKPLTKGVEVFDLGQNAPIMPRITVKGPAGSVVRLTPGNADGSVDRVSPGRGRSWWQYTLGGSGFGVPALAGPSNDVGRTPDRLKPELQTEETWFPKFHYQGCRYLQVERMAAAEGGELPVVEEMPGLAIAIGRTPSFGVVKVE